MVLAQLYRRGITLGSKFRSSAAVARVIIATLFSTRFATPIDIASEFVRRRIRSLVPDGIAI